MTFIEITITVIWLHVIKWNVVKLRVCWYVFVPCRCTRVDWSVISLTISLHSSLKKINVYVCSMRNRVIRAVKRGETLWNTVEFTCSASFINDSTYQFPWKRHEMWTLYMSVEFYWYNSSHILYVSSLLCMLLAYLSQVSR